MSSTDACGFDGLASFVQVAPKVFRKSQTFSRLQNEVLLKRAITRRSKGITQTRQVFFDRLPHDETAGAALSRGLRVQQWPELVRN
jgi:hypothetical protein